MECRDLKNLIETNSEIPFPLILKCPSIELVNPNTNKKYYIKDDYLSLQYARAITEGKDVVYINSVSEILEENGFFDTPTYYIYLTEELNEDVSNYDNLIVIYMKVGKNITEPEHIEMPKLEGWQVEDYVKTKLSGIKADDIEWLCKQAHYDIYRLSNECDKIGIFNESDQQLVFEQIKGDSGYDDISEFNVFDFTNAFIDHDLSKIAMLMKHAEVVDLEPTGIVTILKKQVKKYMDLQMNPKAKASDLNMSDKQFWYLKNHPKFTNKQLIELYDELTAIDYRIKSGNLDIRGDSSELIDTKMLSYVVCKVLSMCC